MLSTITRYTFGTLFSLLLNLIKYPFSKTSRTKLSSAFFALKYPFYGNHHVELRELLTDDQLEVTVLPLKANEHNTTEFELLTICSILKDRGVQHVFEIGTYDGRTTRAMAINTGKDGKVYTLNLPPDTRESKLQTGHIDIELASKVVSGERFSSTPEETKIEQLWGDSAIFDFAPYYGTIDLVFIDGAHSEDYVANDTQKALQLLKKTAGYILWHDAHLYGVADYMKKIVFQQKAPIYFIKGTSVAFAKVENGQFIESKK
ncbi:MAG: class I SAM-dependent methyltransferase [Chitinophagaceae bacterium]|nr:class I SAM-dependent methyltransferase [Chitinophagaceae bacterium]